MIQLPSDKTKKAVKPTKLEKANNLTQRTRRYNPHTSTTSNENKSGEKIDYERLKKAEQMKIDFSKTM